MCFNICVFARDLYLKVLTERYGDKNCVMQIRQFIERTFMFMCTVFFCVLLIHDALIVRW